MWEKTRRGIRKAEAAVLLLAASILLTGCYGPTLKDLRDSLYSEVSIKRAAEKRLKERYGEEFVVHNVQSTSWSTYDAACSPKADRRVVFKIGGWKDGTSIYRDNYGKNAISAQISRKLEDELQEYFSGCYVKTDPAVQVQEGYLNADSIRNLSMKEYAERYPREEFRVDVYVPQEFLKDDTIESEYQYFSEILQGEMKAGEIPYIGIVRIYYVDKEQAGNCREYFKQNYDTFSYETERCYSFSVAYPYEKINRTSEEYEELRRGGM